MIVSSVAANKVLLKAYFSGKQDKDYAELIARVKAIIFLSTPHRGGNGADLMSQLLKTFNMSKEYIRELKANSPFLHSINDDFTKACKELQIFSFYETHETKIGTKSSCVSSNVQDIDYNTDIESISLLTKIPEFSTSRTKLVIQ